MAKKDPTQVAEKWARNLSGATQDITNGVNAVTTAPGQKAAAAADTWLAKVTASKDKWKRNVGRVTLDQWREKMLNVGVQRISQGAQANKDKVSAFMTEFLPYQQRGADQVNTMPKDSLEAGIQRAVAMMRWNAGFKRGSSS